MTREEFLQTHIVRLDIGDFVSNFDCGDKDLSEFIINEAFLYEKALLSVTYLVKGKKTNEVSTYFTLSNDKISISDFESKTEFNRFYKNCFLGEGGVNIKLGYKIKNGRLFHNIPPLCDLVDCHTFTSLSCLTQPLTYNLYHYYLKAF